jgi:prephenate dehydrogenase
MKIGVVGVGLMGGSLCKALKNNYTDCIIYGVNRNSKNESNSLKMGLIDVACTIDELIKKDLDYIFLCISASGIINLMNVLKYKHKHTTIIDFASTKNSIAKKVDKKLKTSFILAHPMCGTEKSGASNAIDDLYTNNVAIICDKKNYKKKHLNKAKTIFKNLKMSIVFMNSKLHDTHTADISHMPHVLSYALSRAVINKEQKKTILSLAGGGFRDMSRIAKSSPKMWVDVFCDNNKNILRSIESVEKEIKKFKKILKQTTNKKNDKEKRKKISKWIEGANKLHKILK